MYKQIIGVGLALFMLLGCQALRFAPRVPQGYTAGQGAEYCQDLSAKSDKSRRAYNILGWGMTVITGGLALVGSVVGNKENGSWVGKNRATLIIGGGLIAAPFAPFFFSRSDAAGAATGAAKRTLALDGDQEQYKGCLAIHAEWAESLKASTAAAQAEGKKLDTERKADAAAARLNEDASVLEEQARQLEEQSSQLELQAAEQEGLEVTNSGQAQVDARAEKAKLKGQAEVLDDRAKELRTRATKKRDSAKKAESGSDN